MRSIKIYFILIIYLKIPIMKHFIELCTGEGRLHEIVLEIERLLASGVKFSDKHHYQSSCECCIPMQDDFYTKIMTGRVRLDVLQYLINKGHLDLANEDICDRVLKSFVELLKSSGSENYDGQSDALHELTLFMIDWLSKAIPDKLISWIDPDHGTTLLHQPFYGFNTERQNEYVMKLLDLGIPLVLASESPGSDEWSQELDDQMKLVGLEKCGQSPICLAARYCSEGHDVLRRMLEIGMDLDTYDDRQFLIDHKDCYTFLPIIPQLLHDMNWQKSPEYFEMLAESIRLLLEAGIDYTLPVYYGNKPGVTHTVTDYLYYYGYVYPGSPVFNAFKGYLLPERMDPTFEHFVERPPYYSKGRPSEYQLIEKKYKYTKDPAMFQKIRDELDRVKATTKAPCDAFSGSQWLFVPQVKEFMEQEQ